MPTADERRSELIAAAVSDELSAAERAELDVLRSVDPAVDREIESLRSMLQAVAQASPDWEQVDASPALRDRILRAAGAVPDPLHASGAARPPRSAKRSRRRRAWVPLLAAACLAVGIGVGALLPPLFASAPAGPPGTLGAIEAVEVRDTLEDATIEAEIVAHTWGTEAILDADGLDVGASYDIVLIGTDGTEFSAGAMLGSEVHIHCRVNAAVLREEVARLEIRGEDRAVVAVADLPGV